MALRPVSPDTHALVIMAKAPVPGAVKSRLVPPLDYDEAAELNRCFIADLSATIGQVAASSSVDGFIAFTPAGSEATFTELVPPSFQLIPQRGDDLTARLINAAAELLDTGYASVALMNSDSPTLPAEYVAEAIAALALPGDRIVIGPAADGGYYLIGVKRPHRRLFEAISWSTDAVFAQTLARAEELCLPVVRLPAWYDIDEPEDLRRLARALGNSPEGMPAETSRAPATRAFLHRLITADRANRLGLSSD